MRNWIKLVLALAIIIVTASPLFAGNNVRRKNIVVSVFRIPVIDGERIVGFDFHITSGRIASLPDIPIGWNFEISNDPSWNTLIKATVDVGAAAIDSKFFRKFLLIEKHDSLGIPFDLTGEIIVSSDMENERRIGIGMKDLKIEQKN